MIHQWKKEGFPIFREPPYDHEYHIFDISDPELGYPLSPLISLLKIRNNWDMTFR